MSDIPVAVFAYKRLDKIQACLSALQSCKLADRAVVFLFCDGYKGDKDKAEVLAVQEFADSLATDNRFKEMTVVKSEHNKGLATSIISGVTDVVNRYGKIIVVEDDLLVAPDFLEYMIKALDFYQEYKEYGEISAYTYPLKSLQEYDKDVYVTRKGECWGWGTWKDRWELVDWDVSTYQEYVHNKKTRKQFDYLESGLDNMIVDQMEGKISSWAVRWCYHLYFHDYLVVYPKSSRVVNDGFDGTGTHCDSRALGSDSPQATFRDTVFERLDLNQKFEREASVYMAPFYVKIRRKVFPYKGR